MSETPLVQQYTSKAVQSAHNTARQASAQLVLMPGTDLRDVISLLKNRAASAQSVQNRN